MLIQLSIENYKSIRNEQIVDFYAPVKRCEMEENTVLLKEDKMRVLRSVGLYGANASGKSTVFEALFSIQGLTSNIDFIPESDIRQYNPYRLDPDHRVAPVKFSLEFAMPIPGILPWRRFVYDIAFTRDKIVHESLSGFSLTKKGLRRIKLFSRNQADTYKTIKVNKVIRAQDGKIVAFFPNQTYLSACWKAADAHRPFRIIASYLCGRFKLSDYTKASDMSRLSHRRVANALMPYADFGIRSVAVRKVGEFRPIPDDISPEKMTREAFLKYIERLVDKEVMHEEYAFSHSSEFESDTLIKLEEESSGTQHFFEILPKLLDVLDNGYTLLRDEIETHMHPFLVEFIIRLFNDPDVNTNNAQLFFSTHNLGLLSESLLRKDQIWFAEKNDGVSSYFSLQDFDDKVVTPSSPFAAWYMEGRFGGVPYIDYANFVKAVKKLREESRDA